MATFGPEIPVHRFTVREVHRMRDAGILAPRARIELLAGLLIDMHRPTPRETKATWRLVDVLARCFRADVVRDEPVHPDGSATFDGTLMVHDWERLPLTAPFPLHRFSIEEFGRMLKIGVLASAERYELLDGVVFDDDRLGDARTEAGKIAARLPSPPGSVVRLHSVVHLGPYSRLRLDVAVCGRRDDGYDSGPPRGQDVLLAIDLKGDAPDVTQLVRWPLYERWNVATAWVIDRTHDEVRVGRRTPTTRGFSVEVHRSSELLGVG